MNELAQIIQENELEPTNAQHVLENFTRFMEEAKKYEEKAQAIRVTDISQIDRMKEARSIRLTLKEIRCNVEDTRKKLKEQSLREGRAIDGIANVVKAVIIPLEEYLESQEKFAENLEKQKREQLLSDRKTLLAQYVDNVEFYNLDVSDQTFEEMLASAKAAKNAKDNAEVLARAAAEKAEQEEKEKQEREAEARSAKEEADRVEKERLAQEAEAAQKKAAEAEAARVKAEQELAEKLRQEEEQKQADAKAKAAAEAQRLEAELAPDKEKIAIFAKSLKAIEYPVCATEKGQAFIRMIRDQIDELSNVIKDNIQNI